MQVATKVPWTAFPSFLWSSGRLGIMAEAQMKTPDCNTKLIGTGPFEFGRWKFDDKFVAKPTRTTGTRTRRRAGSSRTSTRSRSSRQEDSAKRTSSLEAGDFQMIHTSDALQIVQIRKDVKARQARPGHRIRQVHRGRLHDAERRPRRRSTTSTPARRSRTRSTATTYNKLRNNGILQNATGPFAPGVDGYLADTGLPTFDPAKAKAAAAQYKQETGKDLTFTLDHTADPSTTQDAVLIQQMLQQNAGIKMQLKRWPTRAR